MRLKLCQIMTNEAIEARVRINRDNQLDIKQMLADVYEQFGEGSVDTVMMQELRLNRINLKETLEVIESGRDETLMKRMHIPHEDMDALQEHIKPDVKARIKKETFTQLGELDAYEAQLGRMSGIEKMELLYKRYHEGAWNHRIDVPFINLFHMKTLREYNDMHTILSEIERHSGQVYLKDRFYYLKYGTLLRIAEKGEEGNRQLESFKTFVRENCSMMHDYFIRIEEDA